MNRVFFLSGLVLFTVTFAQSSLDDCAEQFIGGDAANAPTLTGTPSNTPFGNNEHLCYRDNGVSFFATEYAPDLLAPVWASYKLDPVNYGPQGCSTFTRKKANCYINSVTFPEFEICDSDEDDVDDFFYRDKMATGETLGSGDFTNIGHDHGHIAPRQAFSWHVCGTHQTFTMANMSAQRAFLNQEIWGHLETQVLTWAFDEGPLFVTTGAVYGDFPTDRFEVFEPVGLNPDQVYASGAVMLPTVEKNLENHNGAQTGDILRPKRKPKPTTVKVKVRDMQLSTGYYKVIFRPATGGQPTEAIAFMLPQSFENLNSLVDFYDGLSTQEAFWVFVSRIDLIEETAGVSFPGIPDAMKSVWGNDFFFERDEIKGLRDPAVRGTGTPQGILVNSTRAQRRTAFTDLLN
jgi:hypothetical protein